MIESQFVYGFIKQKTPQLMKKGIAILIFGMLLGSLLTFTSSFRFQTPNQEFVSAAEFKVYKGLRSFFSDDFDFDFPCGIQKYEVIYQRRGMDPVVVQNNGAKFNTQVNRMVLAAKPGDVYIFRNVQARCEGDAANRRLTSIIVNIR